jgi:hypothetical protein
MRGNVFPMKSESRISLRSSGLRLLCNLNVLRLFAEPKQVRAHHPDPLPNESNSYGNQQVARIERSEIRVFAAKLAPGLASLNPGYAASAFSAALGWRSMIRNSARMAPSGLRRPCS